jgi:hypothetical protein
VVDICLVVDEHSHDPPRVAGTSRRGVAWAPTTRHRERREVSKRADVVGFGSVRKKKKRHGRVGVVRSTGQGSDTV